MNKKTLVTVIVIMIAVGAKTYAQEEIGIDIDGTVWATRNVDMPGTFVEKPEDTGMFYQWNTNRGWSSTNPLLSSDGVTVWERDDYVHSSRWIADNDPCPKGWRVPTEAEMRSLVSSVNTWDALNGVNGRFFKSGNDSIFLPAKGYRARENGALTGNDSYWGVSGRYWTETLNGGYAYFLTFGNNSNPSVSSYENTQGEITYAYCVRCVKDATVSIIDIEHVGIRIYPNPTTDIIYMDTETDVDIKLYSMQGVLIKEIFGKQIDLSAHPSGLYFLSIKGEVVKVIKNK